MRHIALILAFLAFGLVNANAQDKAVQLKLSTWVPPAHPLNPALKAWADDIEKESGGTIKSTLFPSEQLGKAFDHYDMARDGIADFAYVNPGYQPGRFPIIAAGELPFLFANAKGGSAANATMGAFVTLLGGTNVQASAPEARDMLERGVADEITFPWGSIILFGIDKVVKYHMDMPFWTATFTWSMNQAKYDSMSPAQRSVIDSHCTTEWAEKIASPWADFEHAGHDKIAAMPGHEIYSLTPDQIAAWRKAAEPLKAKWAAQVKGADPDTVYNELVAELKKRGALAP